MKRESNNQLSKEKRYQLISVLIHMVILLLLSWPIFKSVIEDWGAPAILLEIEALPEQVSDTYDIPDTGKQKSEGEQQHTSKQINQQEKFEKERKLPSAPKVIAESELEKQKNPEESVEDVTEYIATEDPSEISVPQYEDRSGIPSREKEYERLKADYSNYLTSDSPEKEKESEPEGKEISTSEPIAQLRESIATIGGDLKGRTVIQYPTLDDNTQKKGLVVVRICVDSRGIVRTTRYTQKGSTTTDLYLVDLAVGAARKYIFSASAAERQCGTIAFDFQLK